MLRSDPGVSRVSTALLGVAAILVAGALLFRFGTVRPGADAAIPADILALGTKVIPAAPGGTVSEDVAFQAADRQFGINGYKTSAYLVDLTNPNLLGGITDRAFWIIKVEGFPPAISRPIAANGQPASVVESPTTLYIYIDADTGEFTMAQTP
jgi:hypothetical protein